jgi:hypothetical protein
MSFGQTKDAFVSGASTPLTAVAAEPLSITESVPPPPPSKVSSGTAIKKKTFSPFDKRSLDDVKKDIVAKETESVSKDSRETANVPTTAEQPEAQENLATSQRNGSRSNSLSSSISSSIKTQRTKSKPSVSTGRKILHAEQDLRSRELSASHTPSPRDIRKEEGSGKKYNREALLEEYNALQKERKALRKRNLQAQTNIAQYMRKHR